MPPFTRGRKLLFASAALALGCVLALAAAELYVRLFSAVGYVTPEIYQRRSGVYEPALFARHVLARREQTIENAEGQSLLTINRWGYRGPDFFWEKPAGTIRILVYGGSQVFNAESQGDRDWPHRIGNLLRERGHEEVEVINAGISGHASFDSLGRFYAEGHLLDPDYVLFCNAWNDIKEFRSDQPLLRSLKPYRGNPFHEYQGGFDRYLCEHSQLFVRLRDRYYKWSLRAGPEGTLPEGAVSGRLAIAPLRQYKLTAQLFADAVRNAGAVPVLLTQPRLVARGNTEAERARIRYDYILLTPEALCDAFEATDRILAGVAEEKNCLLLDASAALTGESRYFGDHVHLTDEGAEELAKLCADLLERLLNERSAGADKRTPDAR